MNDEESIQLVTEQTAIDALGLTDRPNPRGALRWLLRTKQLGYVRLGRGIIGFRPVDIKEFIESRHIPARRHHAKQGAGNCTP